MSGNNFTEIEIEAAKEVRENIIHSGTDELKAIYMAGEICMWDELRQANEANKQPDTKALDLLGVSDMLPTFTEIEKAAELHHKKNDCLAVERKAFELGADWIVNEFKERLRNYR